MWLTSGIAFAPDPNKAGQKIALSLKKLANRYRQKIFTTNNHYEWSK
jgi:hypothetical protein